MNCKEAVHQRGSQRRRQLLVEINSLCQEVEDYYRQGIVGAERLDSVSGFLDDARLYLEIGKESWQMPANWVEKSLLPSVEELLLFSHSLARV